MFDAQWEELVCWQGPITVDAQWTSTDLFMETAYFIASQCFHRLAWKIPVRVRSIATTNSGCPRDKLVFFFSPACRYCGTLWDQYRLCSTQPCRQLVLTCPQCRLKGLTACCPLCQEKGLTLAFASSKQAFKEECECTDTRQQVPVERV